MPSRLGRYVVQRRIGSGGFATVWLAYDEQLDSPVAVKVLADNWTEDAHIRRRFLEEGRYLRRVESPHVVTVYDAGELDDGRPYLVMTYADQGTLAERLDATSDLEGGGLTTAQAMEVVRQVARGLQALHDRDILHRDVKPANVLFRTVSGGSDVRAMVGDLGLGKALDMSSRLTMIAGTPSFVAPEQAAAEPVDARADQYSLAALSYLLLAGRVPFDHADLKAAADPGEMPPLSTPERPLPEAADAVVRRGLAFAPCDRFESVTAYADALDEALGSAAVPAGGTAPWLPIDQELTLVGARPTAVPRRDAAPGAAVAPEVGRPRRRTRWVAALAVAAMVLATAAGIGGYAYHRSQTAAAPASVQLTDDSGQLTVTVPAGWDAAQSLAGWTPPGQGRSCTTADPDCFAALSAGTSPTWKSADSTGHGVFVGLLAADKLPTRPPRHPECQTAGPEQEPYNVDGETLQRTYSGCPGGVVIERVVQVANGMLMWVQVRAATRAEAGTVLDTARPIGL
jgi:hypothetical protein